MTPGVGGRLPKRAGLKGEGASSQSASASATQTGRPSAAQTWFSTMWSQCPCVSSTATGVTSRRLSVSCAQALEPMAGSTTQAEPPRASATMYVLVATGPKVPPRMIMRARLAGSWERSRSMRIAIASDEVTALTDALVAALRDAGHELTPPRAAGRRGRGVGRGERRGRARGGRGPRRARGRVLLVGHRRVDRGEQGGGRARRALRRSADRPHGAPLQPRQRARAVAAAHQPADGEGDRRGVPRRARRRGRLRPAQRGGARSDGARRRG